MGRVKIAKALLAAGANVNAQDVDVSTPLHDAARLANYKMVCLLLENGAQIDAKDASGKTPDQLAPNQQECQQLFDEFRNY